MLRGTHRGARVVVLTFLCLCWASSSALADGPVGANPAHNFGVGQLPLACNSAPTSAACINGAVYWLDRARAALHQGAYRLPANFASLSPDKQAFILTNLDRIRYKLPPITGLTRELGRFALGGVRADGDPLSADADFQDATSNWAGAYPNMVVAYEAWMYDDGLGSTNQDCSATHRSGCWGHRHDVLWRFAYEPGAYAMGAAAGRDRSGRQGYAMLLGRGDARYAPVYYYTWAQAVAAGAGTHNYVVHRPAKLQVSVKAAGRNVLIYISAPPRAHVKCQLTKKFQGRWEPAPFYSCGGLTTYPHVSPGRYRVRVKGEGLTVTNYVRVT